HDHRENDRDGLSHLRDSDPGYDRADARDRMADEPVGSIWDEVRHRVHDRGRLASAGRGHPRLPHQAFWKGDKLLSPFNPRSGRVSGFQVPPVSPPPLGDMISSVG
ncbi:MAG: hypothetical protein UU35_C0012G0030, partial [Candidatus Uhrbacteria bacterium GW2011_GWC2_41_11]